VIEMLYKSVITKKCNFVASIFKILYSKIVSNIEMRKSTQLDFTAEEAHLFPPMNTLDLHLRFLGLLCHIMSIVWCAVTLQILKKMYFSEQSLQL